MTDQINPAIGGVSRRQLLGWGGLASAGLLLAACSSSGGGAANKTGSTGGANKNLGQLRYAFSWLEDVTQAGPYVSDTKGYYVQSGFSSVKFLPGGPSAVSVLTQMANGDAQFGVSSPTEIVAANTNGASFRVIGAMYQNTPACVVSLAGKPLRTPSDLKGKTIGVAAADKPAMTAFLAVNGLKTSDMKLVPFQYDPAPLIDGQMDGYLGYSTGDPITLQEAGHPAVILNFSDFGYTTITQTYVANTSQIAHSRDLLKAALRADIMGWRDCISSPIQGATLAATKYGKSLGYSVANQLACLEAEIMLMKTPDTEANGILTVTPTLQSQTVQTLARSGSKTTVADLFDLTLLAEVYQEHPELKTLS